MSQSDEYKVFEVISVYFSNTYFVALYDKACDYYNDEKFPTIEDSYRSTLENFNNAFRQTKSTYGKHNEFYPTILNDLRKTFNNYTKNVDTPTGFIDRLVRCILPNDEYLGNKNDVQMKDDIVRAILTRTVAAFTVYTINEDLDNAVSLDIRKSPEAGVEKNKEWKNKFKSLLDQQKREYASIVIAKRNGVEISNKNDLNLSKEIIERYEKKIHELVSEKQLLIQERNKLLNISTALLSQVRELEKFKNDTLLIRPYPEYNTTVSDYPKQLNPSKQSDSPKQLNPSKQSRQSENTLFSDYPKQSDNPNQSIHSDIFKQSTVSNNSNISNSPKQLPHLKDPTPTSEMPAVKDIIQTKYGEIDIQPEVVKKFHDINQMDEIPTEENFEEYMSEDDEDLELDDNSDLSEDE